MAENDSTSGEITAAFVNVTNVFTQYTEIPSNGFNALYKAQRYGKWFVLKGLKPEFRNSVVHLQLLTKEFELGIQMSHPNIVQYYSKEVDPVAGDCIVMEYVDGDTLTKYLQKQKKRLRRDDKIAMQLLQAMAYYHGLQIVHRDLKPDNILISRNGNNVKIIDFGLGDSDTSAILKQPAGSPKYVAPEQRKGDIKIDARADLYSFSLIIKQLSLSGKWTAIQRVCGYEDRDRRPIDATAVLVLVARKRIMNIVTAVVVIMMLLMASVIVFSRFIMSAAERTHGTQGKGTLVLHDTIVMKDTSQYHDVMKTDTVWTDLPPAEITTEMQAFIRADIDRYWQPMADMVTQNQKRIDELAAGVAGDINEDKRLYDQLLKKYGDLCNGSAEHQQKFLQLLRKKFPSAYRISNADIYLGYAGMSNKIVSEYSALLTTIYQDIDKAATKREK